MNPIVVIYHKVCESHLIKFEV